MFNTKCILPYEKFNVQIFYPYRFLYLRVIFNRKVFVRSCNIEVNPIEIFDAKRQFAKGKSINAQKINAVIAFYSEKLNSLYLSQINGKKITKKDIQLILKQSVTSNENGCTGFFDFYKNKLLPEKKKELRYGGWKKYLTEYNKLLDFNPSLDFDDFNHQMMIDYANYLRKIGNCENTVQRALRQVKIVLNHAVNMGVILDNPVSDFKTREIQGNRAFLSKDELIRLRQSIDLMPDNARLEVLKYFLFSCYTGLRYSDIQQLKFSHITNDTIRLRMIKTNNEIFIPLNNKAKEILSMQNKDSIYVFRCYCNQVTNRHLKDIAKIACIDKHLTFHVARHTFATVSIELGIPIEVVSRLLGHSDIKTTQIYARIVDNVKIREMQKWNF